MTDTKTTEAKTEIAVAPAPKPPLVGGGRVAAIVPGDFESCYRLATVVKASGMAPKSFSTVESITVAMMHGMELGLTPMAALQSIAVVNGTPTVFGDGMLALVRASGLLEDIQEEIERDKEGVPTFAFCKVKRAGQASWVARGFTRAEAMKAGLWNKAGPWTQYPQRMLQMRARSWALRDAFADVLRGLQQTEEVTDMLDVGGGVAAAEPTMAQFRQAAPAGDATRAGITDVVEQTAAVETRHDPETGEVAQDDAPTFDKFETFRAFEEFSDHFLRNASAAEATAWEAHYRVNLAQFAKHKAARIQEATAALISLYSGAIAPAEAA